MASFALDSRLAGETLQVADLDLCSLRLMNDCRFPWLLLIPRRPGCVEVLDLQNTDQARLGQETLALAQLLRAWLNPDKINIAALGNQVAQLHVHVIARFRTDCAWPAPVWGVGPAQPYADQGRGLMRQLQEQLAGAGLIRA